SGRRGVYHQCTGVEHPVPRAAVEGYDGAAAVERSAPDLPDDPKLVVPLILGPVKPPRGWVDGQPNRIVHPMRRGRAVMDCGRAAAVKRGALDLVVAVVGPVDLSRTRVERQPQRDIQPVPRACVDRVDWPAAIKRSAPDRGFGVVVVDPVDAVGQRGEPIPTPESEARGEFRLLAPPWRIRALGE